MPVSDPRHRGRRRTWAVRALLFAGIAAGAAAARAQAVDDGLLTMEIEARPLAEVLEEIAAAAGFELAVQGDLGEAVPQTFEAVPLDVAIRRLVGSHSVVMIHAPEAAGRPAEVRVYAVEEDPEARRQASVQQARRAARAADRTGRAARVEQAGDDDRAARVQRVRELARSGDPSAVGDLAGMLARDPDPAIRRLAVGALAGTGDPGATDALAGALGDEDRAVRVQAVRALHNLLGDGVAPYLGQVVSSDEEPAVRMLAVQLAADLPGGPAIDVLERALADPDEQIREMAEAALDR